MTKRILTILILVAVVCSLVACGSITSPNTDDNNTTTVTGTYASSMLSTLSDLPNYGTSGYANAEATTYSDASDEIATLDDKIASTQADNKSDGVNYDWDVLGYDDSISTISRIFSYMTGTDLVKYFAEAAVTEGNMSASVAYIARDDAEEEYNMVVGVGSAIQDYEEYDELYSLYEENEDDETYDLMQLKKRKIIAEITDIFGDSGAEFARACVQILAYAQITVVDDMMILESEYASKTIDQTDYITYFKEVLFDYDTVVYFLSYNEETGFVPYDSDRTIGEKLDITELFGYYYHYEKADYEVFERDADGTDSEYIEYLRLSHLTVLTDDEALEYNQMQSDSYEFGYRYSYSFYKTYYALHFEFQALQEEYDMVVYGISEALSGKSLTYSSQMLTGLNSGFESSLLLSDASWAYTTNSTNVTTMNARNTAWNGLTESEQNQNKNLIYLVLLERQELIAQYAAMTFNATSYSMRTTDNTASVITNDNLDEATKYQVYNTMADYIRAIQSYKKESVLLTAELSRMTSYTGITDEDIADKQEELGRNDALSANMGDNYTNAAFDEQISSNDNWDNIKEDIMEGISTESDYQTYSDTYSGTPTAKQVDEYFEDNLIKKTYDYTDPEMPVESYDTNHDLSLFVNTYEATLYYMYGIIEVEYKESSYSNTSVLIDEQYHVAAFTKSSTYADGLYNGTGVLSSLNTYTNAYKTTAVSSAEYGTDETVELAVWSGGKWTGTYIGESTGGAIATITVTDTNATGGNKTYYTYTYEFIGWYLDAANLYPALADVTYDYNIRLYAGYRITVVKN